MMGNVVDDFLENEEFRDALIAFRGRVSKDEWGSFAGALKSLIRADGSAGWQPIDTAPQGGSRKMFVVKAFNVIVRGHEYTSDPYCVWRDSLAFSRWPHAFDPTHWMPLPDAPKEGT